MLNEHEKDIKIEFYGDVLEHNFKNFFLIFKYLLLFLKDCLFLIVLQKKKSPRSLILRDSSSWNYEESVYNYEESV